MSMVAGGHGALRARQPRHEAAAEAARARTCRSRTGWRETLEEIERASRRSSAPSVAEFLDGLVSHYVLDDGKLVVAHAGMKEEMQGRGSGKVRDFALYGETTGETDEFGLPVRYDWAAEYRGQAMVVYGHTPVPEPEWLNRTVNIDTGCVFGGKLTALRYPEKEFVSVPAPPGPTASRPGRSCPPSSRPRRCTAQQAHDDVLDAEDVLGKRIVPTRLRGNVTIREENAAAALEVMSRFAADPKWLIYLPPTMSPCETSRRAGPAGAPGRGVRLLPQPGRRRRSSARRSTWARGRSSIVCRDEAGGAASGSASPTGETRHRLHPHRPAVLRRRRTWSGSSSTGCATALTAADLWDELETDWVCLDCELMPWSAKAQELLRDAVRGGRRGGAASPCPRRWRALAEAGARGRDEQATLLEPATASAASRRRPVRRRLPAVLLAGGVARRDLKLAPFHLLATEGRVHTDKDHVWHMETLADGLPGRPGAAAGDAVPGRGRDRPGERGGGRSPGGRS